MSDWFSVFEGEELEQGDILRSCSVFSIANLPDNWPVPNDFVPQVGVDEADLIILTQSCDLENSKVNEVVLGRVLNWKEVQADLPFQNEKERENFRKRLVEGIVPNLSLLRRFEQDGVTLPWSVVDFHQLFILRLDYLRRFALQNGKRLRLISPYKEQLSQAFARYFMRVGLPHQAAEFVQEGK